MFGEICQSCMAHQIVSSKTGKLKLTGVILQPSFLPWIGYFEQFYKSDIFILYDDVQYDKNGWRNRNRIRTRDGWQWITVPVSTKGKFGQLNSEILIEDNDRWKKKILAAIRQNYSKAFGFDLYYPTLEHVISKARGRLLELNVTLFSQVASWLGFERDLRLSSSLAIPVGLNPTERLIEICRIVGLNVFYEGGSGRNYIENEKFKEAGINLVYQNYIHPVYRQQYPHFESHMSIVDLLFNYGKESRDMLLDNQQASNINVSGLE